VTSAGGWSREFLPDVDDVFLLNNPAEVSEVLFDLYHGLGGGPLASRGRRSTGPA